MLNQTLVIAPGLIIGHRVVRAMLHCDLVGL